jgi:hypothetical protein
MNNYDTMRLALAHIEANPDEVWYDDGAQEYYRTTRESLARLGAALRAGRGDAYSHWCAEDSDREQVVLVEEMPDCLRGSHRAARNWGRWPMNGAKRRWVGLDEAEAILAADPDGYAYIVDGD